MTRTHDDLGRGLDAIDRVVVEALTGSRPIAEARNEADRLENRQRRINGLLDTIRVCAEKLQAHAVGAELGPTLAATVMLDVLPSDNSLPSADTLMVLRKHANRVREETKLGIWPWAYSQATMILNTVRLIEALL